MGDKTLIKCPKCGRILGDTARSVDCTINCPQCKAVEIKLDIIEPYEEVIG